MDEPVATLCSLFSIISSETTNRRAMSPKLFLMRITNEPPKKFLILYREFLERALTCASSPYA
jgi:hypothetical protein